MGGPVWELGAVKGVHLAAPPGYGSRTQKEKINGQPIEKSNKFSRRRRRRRNGETTVFGCFSKFEVAGSRQAFRAACSRFYQPAAAFRFRPKRPLQSEYFWDFWAFLQIGQLRCNKPPKPHPERYAPSYPGTAGRAEIRSAPEPWYGS